MLFFHRTCWKSYRFWIQVLIPPCLKLRDTKALLNYNSDNTLRIWSTVTPTSAPVILRGHGSRIWDVDSNARGDRILSASGDKTVKVWDWDPEKTVGKDDDRSRQTLRGNAGDVYSARWHPTGVSTLLGSNNRVLGLILLPLDQTRTT